jgi:hypothetical protein
MDIHAGANKTSPFLGFDFEEFTQHSDMNNKLFCTFVTEAEIKQTVQQIQDSYIVLYDKIFILSLQDGEGYVCTYNVDLGNVGTFLENTILVHRKKHTNTLYTINALNQLICELNGGYLNKQYNVNWEDYSNSILLTRENALQVLKTELYNIIKL